MKWPFALVCIAVVTVGCGEPVAPTHGPVNTIPANGVLLRLSGTPGDIEKMETLIVVGGSDSTSTVTTMTTSTLQLVRGDKLTYQVVMDDVKVDGDSPMTKQLAALKGKRETVICNGRGKVTNVSGELGGQAAQIGWSTEFPPRKVKVGDTWTQESTTEIEPVTLVNKFEGFDMLEGKKCLLISFTARADSSLVIQPPAKMWIDPNTGRIARSEMVVESKTTPKVTMRVVRKRLG